MRENPKPPNPSGAMHESAATIPPCRPHLCLGNDAFRRCQPRGRPVARDIGPACVSSKQPKTVLNSSPSSSLHGCTWSPTHRVEHALQACNNNANIVLHSSQFPDGLAPPPRFGIAEAFRNRIQGLAQRCPFRSRPPFPFVSQSPV
eukprot:scaffold1724_cov341-Pavlova_lutheri.AAC.28